MPITLDGTNGITTPTYGGADTSEYLVPVTQFKNRIINGAMVIDQRNAGASGTAFGYTVDRWAYSANQASKLTWQQNAGSVTPPTGFSNYLGITSSSAYSVGATDYFLLTQSIEGFNFADCAWGTANAKTITLSFWVRSSLTGTFGGALQNSAQDRSYPFSYTISSANTWEQKSVTIAGDTSGTWIGATNGIGLRIYFSVGTGSTYSTAANAWANGFFTAPTGAVSVVGTNGATFYITGVQLEVGSTATSFDYRPYGTELQLCQRYYARIVDPTCRGVSTSAAAGGASRLSVMFPVTMRAYPTFTTSGTFNFWNGSTTRTATTATGIFGSTSTNMLDFDMDINAAFPAASQAVCMYAIGSSPPSIMLSAEL